MYYVNSMCLQDVTYVAMNKNLYLHICTIIFSPAPDNDTYAINCDSSTYIVCFKRACTLKMFMPVCPLHPPPSLSLACCPLTRPPIDSLSAVPTAQ